MVTKFGATLSLIGLSLSFSFVAAQPSTAATEIDGQQQVSNQKKDESPNRGNGRRELYINIARSTVQ